MTEARGEEETYDDDDDDIFIMMKRLYVCMFVTFLPILPSLTVFTSDDPPWPSRPKAGLGVVMIMMMLLMMMIMMTKARVEEETG